MDSSLEHKDLIENTLQPLETDKEQKEQEQLVLSKQEKKNLCVLTLLYTIQGIAIGFFYVAIPILLAEKGATYKDLSVFSIILYPFSFKILFAPLLDTYYFNNFGKRKSYIVPLQYILGGVFLHCSYQIEGWINEQNIGYLTLVGFTSILIAATQDIAVDGLVLTMLGEHHVGLGSNCQSAGQITGTIISSSLFIQLNSQKFCLQYLGVDQLLSYQTFFQCLAMFIFVVTIYLHLMVTEQKQSEIQINQQQSLTSLIVSLKGFLTNPNLFKYICFLLFWRTGFAPVEASASVMLLQKGFDKETMSLVSTVMTPVSLMVPIILTKLLDYLCTYLLVIFYSPCLSFTCLFSVSALYSTIYQSIGFVNMGSFNNRISDTQGGGTFLTFLASAANLGGMWSPSLALYLLTYVSYNYLVLLGFIYTLLFYFLYFPKMYSLQTLNKSAFNLYHKTQ